MRDSAVYYIRYIREPSKPRIDWDSEANQGIKWDSMRPMLLGTHEVDRALFRETTFAIAEPHVADWDHFTVPGFGDFFSARVTNILATHSAANIEFIETRVNSHPYFCPRRIGGLDCLDDSRSRPWAQKFFIKGEKIADPLVFLLPEKPDGWPNRPDPNPIFLTQSVQAIIAVIGVHGLHVVETGKIRLTMSLPEVAELESSLGFSVPKAYQKFVVNYPAALVTTEIDLSWKKEAPADRQLRIDPIDVLALNRDVRCPGTPWTEDEGPWPEHFFVIGDDECGNYWALDQRRAESSAVYFYDHDYGKFTKEHDSLDGFAKHLVEYVEDWNKDKARRS